MHLRGHGARRFVLPSIVSAVAGLALVLPSAASADGGGQAAQLSLVPQQQQQPPKKTPGGDATTQSTVSPGQSYRCDSAGTMRRAPNSYVLGWCPVGTHIDISSTSNAGWQAGWAHGNYENCGWFQSSVHQLTPEGTFDYNCQNATFAETTFASYVNVTPTDDGTNVAVNTNCTRYLNVKPWSTSPTTPQNPVGTLLTTDTFKWRYLSRNGDWVLGRMERPGTSVYYDWAFVPRTCVGVPFGNFRQANPNG